jgi:peptidyl-prolyl cis-trans isomerase D
MSNALRKKRANSVVWALLALLILGLGGFGVTNFSSRVTSIGSVGDRNVDALDYARALNREMTAMSAQLGQRIGFAEAQALGMDTAVQSQLFAAAALDNESDRLGLSVGDAELQKRILSVQAFQGLDGAFDRETYAMVLEQQGMSEAEFEEKLRDETARGLLQSAAFAGAKVPAAYADTIALWSSEVRDFTLARILPSDLPEPVPEPADTEVQAYYDANPLPFTAPETRKLTTLWLSPDMVAAEAEVDEAALREAYEARIDEFVVPERRLVERLVFESDAAATEAKARIDSGETDFASVVAERGLSLADIDLGEQSREDLGAAGDAIFSLTEPGLIGPLPSEFGPALYSMNAILVSQETTFEEARDELDGEARMDRARRIIADRSAGIEDLLASGASLEDVAKEAGMELGQLSYTAESEGGLAGYSAFRDAAAAVTADDFPELVPLDDGGVFALRLDEIVAPTLRPLEEVRDDVVAAWTKDETLRRLTERAAEIAALVDNGATLESLGLVTTRYEGFARGGHVADAPGDIASAVFEAAAGKSRTVVADGQVHLAAVTAVHPADLADPEVGALRGQIEARASQGLSQDLLDLFTTGIQSEAGITLNSSAIAAINAQLQ